MTDQTLTTPIAPSEQIQDHLTPQTLAIDTKKLAGKYDTVEALEEGYKNSSKEALKFKQLADESEAKLKAYVAPEDYVLPEGMTAPDESVTLLKGIAKEAGMTQSQFEKSLFKLATIETEASKKKTEEIEAKQKAKAEALAKIDPAELALVQDFASRKLPKPLADAMLENITNPEVFEAAKSLRAKVLDNRLFMATGTDTAMLKTITDEDVKIAQKEFHDAQWSPNRNEKYKAYIDAATANAKQKRG